MNFTNISNAIKAIDGIKIKPEDASLRIAHGKDRCANPPRSGPQGMSSLSTLVGGARRRATGTVTGVPGVMVSGGGEVHEGDDGGGGVGDVAFLVDARWWRMQRWRRKRWRFRLLWFEVGDIPRPSLSARDTPSHITHLAPSLGLVVSRKEKEEKRRAFFMGREEVCAF